MGRHNRRDKRPKKPVAEPPEETSEPVDGSDKEAAAQPPKIRSVAETCDLIAELGESILEDPESAFFSTTTTEDGHKGLSKMRQLLALCQINPKQTSSTSNPHIAKLAILSTLAIFQDILPSYRIRVPTAQEMSVRVSKETKKVWDYERNLLHHYQQYLQLLEKGWSNQQQQGPPTLLQTTCMLALCQLLQSAFHFNFRSNLLNAVVRQMNTGRSVVVSDACCAAIEHVFRRDAQGDVAAEAARLVAKTVRNAKKHLRPAVLKTFLALPLTVHADEAEAAKIAQAAKKKNRKRNRELAAIEAEQAESQATVDKMQLARSQSDTLQAITLVYFAILKDRTRHDLLPAALEGLAKFAHLIHMDTVMDLLAHLKELLLDVQTLPLEAALNCIWTAFQTLQGPGKALQIDIKDYMIPLYSQLPRLVTNDHCTSLVLKCLDWSLIQRREYSQIRVAAFFKQILGVALHSPPTTSVPLLAFCRQLSQRYSSVEQMLENENDVITTGTYDPTVMDPEHSNPLATSAWELSLLSCQMHPRVAQQAQAAARAKILALPAEAPERLRRQLLEGVVEYERQTKKHPLLNRKKATCITPRHKTLRLVQEEL